MKAAICIGVIGVATALAVGCKGDPPATGTGAGTGSAAGTGGSATPGPIDAAALRTPTPVTAAAVEAVVAAWLEAQNHGGFDAYQQLYAARMEGVKRVGARTWTFDRAGWLADRQRMFRNPMAVAARDLKISPFLGSAAVDLIQTFSQGKFRDEGMKRLILVDERGTLRIAREEMLESSLLPSARGSHGAAGVRQIITLDGAPYVVVHDAVPATWGGADATLVLDAELKLATRPATGLPADLVALTGTALRSFAADGSPCVATIGDLLLVAGGTPPDQTVQAWNGDPGAGVAGLDPVARAAAVFDLGRPLLLGRLTAIGCVPAVAIDAGTPVFFPAVAADPTVEPAVVAAFRDSPQYRSLQRTFVDEHRGQGPWLATPLRHHFAGAGRSFVAIGGSFGDDCGPFAGAQWALYELGTAGPRLISSVVYKTFTPVLLFDSDGDGVLEMIGTDPSPGTFAIYATVGRDGVRPQSQVKFPFLDYRC